MNTMLLDHQLKEQFTFADSSFPIQYFVDNLSQCPGVPMHWHFGHEFFSAATHDVEVRIGNTLLLLHKGESILITGNQFHSYRQIVSGSDCLCPNIVFSGELLASLASTVYQRYFQPILNDPAFPYIVFSSTESWHKEVCSYLFTVYSLLSKYGAESCYIKNPDASFTKPVTSSCPEIDVLQKMLEIFKIIYHHQENLLRQKVLLKDQQTQIRLQKMLFYIQEHYSEKITLPSLSASAGISRSEAGRCFKSYYDRSPMNYVTDYRLKQAQKLLTESTMTVQEISLQCGFQDCSYFIKVFRRSFGMTPSEYRK